MTRAWLLAAALAAPAPAGAAQAPFYRSDSVAVLALRTDLRRLLRDRDTADVPWRAATVSWTAGDTARSVPAQVRTRGVYRLRHCDFPPIRLRFDGDSVRGTPFAGLRRPKLVTHCMERSDYEQNLLQEYALYRVFRLLTPAGYAARLVRVSYQDSAGAVRPVTRYAILTEDPERLAERLGGEPFERQGVRFYDLDPDHTALLATFQYFAGNTDFSVPGLHNIDLVRRGDTIWGVPYDYDWAGIIDAPYARPSPQLRIRTVRDRIWRGPCLSSAQLEAALLRFETLRDSITAVYRGLPDLPPRTLERALRYIDDFYREVADRPRFERRVAGECIPR